MKKLNTANVNNFYAFVGDVNGSMLSWKKNAATDIQFTLPSKVLAYSYKGDAFELSKDAKVTLAQYLVETEVLSKAGSIIDAWNRRISKQIQTLEERKQDYEDSGRVFREQESLDELYEELQTKNGITKASHDWKGHGTVRQWASDIYTGKKTIQEWYTGINSGNQIPESLVEYLEQAYRGNAVNETQIGKSGCFVRKATEQQFTKMFCALLMQACLDENVLTGKWMKIVEKKVQKAAE